MQKPEQTIQVLLLPWVAETGSERGYVRQIVIGSIGIVIAAGVADDLTGSVLHRYKARTGVHREGQPALHQPDSAELPVAQQGSCQRSLYFLGVRQEASNANCWRMSKSARPC